VAPDQPSWQWQTPSATSQEACPATHASHAEVSHLGPENPVAQMHPPVVSSQKPLSPQGLSKQREVIQMGTE
jgi:hypothetical protein